MGNLDQRRGVVENQNEEVQSVFPLLDFQLPHLLDPLHYVVGVRGVVLVGEEEEAREVLARVEVVSDIVVYLVVQFVQLQVGVFELGFLQLNFHYSPH